MASGDEELIEVSPAEERKFILQAALAPFSVVKRLVFDHKNIWRALAITIDRDEFVKDLRSRQATKRTASPA